MRDDPASCRKINDQWVGCAEALYCLQSLFTRGPFLFPFVACRSRALATATGGMSKRLRKRSALRLC